MMPICHPLETKIMAMIRPECGLHMHMNFLHPLSIWLFPLWFVSRPDTIYFDPTTTWFSSYLLFLGGLFGLNFPTPGTSVREAMTAQAEHLPNSSTFGFYSLPFSSHFIASVHFYYPSLWNSFFNFITFLFSSLLPMI
jgi:hypothetical protein